MNLGVLSTFVRKWQIDILNYHYWFIDKISNEQKIKRSTFNFKLALTILEECWSMRNGEM